MSPCSCRAETSLNRGAEPRRANSRLPDRRAAVGPQDQPGAIARNTVDEARLQEGSGHLPAALDQDPGQAARAQRLRRRRNIDAAVAAASTSTISTPSLFSASRRSAGAALVHTSQTGVTRADVASFDRGDRRACESSTMRTGERRAKPRQAAGEFRIVGRSGRRADQDGVMDGAQAVAVASRRLAGDPLALAGSRRDAAVERAPRS